MSPVATGDTVKVTYTGRLTDGTVFDTSEGKQPLTFILGRQEVIPGFEKAIEGMVMGEKKTVTISAEEGYGPHHERLVDSIPRSELPDDLNLVEGGQLEVTRKDGSIFHLLVLGIEGENVTLDANHPLAGKELTFEIDLLEVTKASPKPA